jgi:hypothetical protein
MKRTKTKREMSMTTKTTKTIDQYADAFHAHLDYCERCKAEPFNLCKIGQDLLFADLPCIIDTLPSIDMARCLPCIGYSTLATQLLDENEKLEAENAKLRSGGMRIRGWFCLPCGGFMGEERELHETCIYCDRPKNPQPEPSVP